MAVPVYVIVRDRLEQLKRTVSAIEKAQGIDLVLVDNDSTYEPTVEYLRQSPHQVVFTGSNHGHHSPWVLGLLPEHGPFGLTDPDVCPVEECPTDWPEKMLGVLERHPSLIKSGFSLRIDNIPDHYQYKQDVLTHETQFWVGALLEEWEDGTKVHHSAVDTTMAFYRNRNTGWDIWPAARLGWPYTAEHLAWYVDSSNLLEDEVYYRQHCDKNVASWKYNEEH